MTVRNVLKRASLPIIVAALAIPLHVSANEPGGLASQFQATAVEAAASFRKELELKLAPTIRPSIRLDTRLAVTTNQLEDVDRQARLTSIDQSNKAGSADLTYISTSREAR